jgi:hypothetical protein
MSEVVCFDSVYYRTENFNVYRVNVYIVLRQVFCETDVIKAYADKRMGTIKVVTKAKPSRKLFY